MSEGKKLTVYVRLGPNNDDRSRELSLSRPKDMPSKELLHAGFAIDGNEISMGIGSVQDGRGHFIGYGTCEDDAESTLSGALISAQHSIMSFLERHGYEVEFD